MESGRPPGIGMVWQQYGDGQSGSYITLYAVRLEPFPDPVFSWNDYHICRSAYNKNIFDTTYVSYKDVKDNEFFMISEEALRKAEELKKQMLALYPGG